MAFLASAWTVNIRKVVAENQKTTHNIPEQLLVLKTRWMIKKKLKRRLRSCGRRRGEKNET